MEKNGSHVIQITKSYIMDPDGSNQQMIKNNTDHHIVFPVWSPDGTSIAFQSERDGNFEIYIVTMDVNTIASTILDLSTGKCETGLNDLRMVTEGWNVPVFEVGL